MNFSTYLKCVCKSLLHIHFVVLVADDFLPLSSLRTFQPGQTDSECVPVTIVDDNIPEETEALIVTLTSNDQNVIPTSSSAVVSIQDNDGTINDFSIQ